MNKNDSAQLISLTTGEVKKHLQTIIEKKIPLRRKRKNGDFSFIPPKEFDKFLKSQDRIFYIEKESFKILDKGSINFNAQLQKDIPPEPEADDIYAESIKEAEQMSILDRIKVLEQHNLGIKNFIEENHDFDTTTMSKLGDIFSQSLCINKATYEDSSKKPVDGNNTGQVIKNTIRLIDNLMYMIRKSKATYKELNELDCIKTGSNTLNHMNRMVIRFISFLIFYNNYFQKFSIEVKKFRAHFKEIYFPYYDKVVKGSQKINLEIVFKGGISPITEREKLIEYTLGCFLHDIGKFPEIKYHDGSESFDIKKASKHVFDGYNLLVLSQKFSNGIIATSLLHHDYYGAPFGYRQLDTFKSKFIDRRKEKRDEPLTKFFISENINDVGYGTTFAYFPNKIIEILDVYDAMTDKDKKYRAKALTPEKAIDIMREEFIETQNLGLDPILFNIFLDFLQSSCVIDQLAVEKNKISKRQTISI